MEPVLVVVGAMLVVDAWLWHRRFVRALDAGPAPARPPAGYPALSVIRPVRGLDIGAEDNFRAALASTYPGEVETLFVFDDDSDPAVPVARRVVADHRASGARGRADILFAGARPPRRTGKLHAMFVGMRHARGTLIAFGDSDTRPSPDLLTGLVDALLASPDVGCTFAPVVVRDAPRTSGDVGYALMINGLYGPCAAWAAGADRRLPYIMGQIMVFRPEALAAIGGLACAEGQLVDDMYIGRRVRDAGFANVMIERTLAITNSGTSLRQFLHTYRRWMLFGQDGIPTSCSWPLWVRGAGTWLAATVILGALAFGAGWAVLAGLAALVAQSESHNRLHARFGGSPIPLRYRWVAPALFLVAPIVLASMRWHNVEWRGRAYTLRGSPEARLAGAELGTVQQ